MPDLLSGLWPHLDSLEPLFFRHAFAWLSAIDWERLVAAGYLQQADPAEAIPCPSCGEDHVEEVYVWRDANGTSRFYISCPESLRVEISPDLLHQWRINIETILHAVAKALSLTGRCTELVPGRLWRLGRTKWQDVCRDLLFARGLGWSDGRGLARQIAHTIRPILFVADRLSDPALWPRRAVPVIALSQVASTTTTDGVLAIDHDAVCATVLQADGADEPVSITSAQLKTIIRQQVKAESKSQLTDDVLLAAYQQEGSVRKAALFLSERTGQPITKDRVQNALKRSGGVGSVARCRGHNRRSSRQNRTSIHP